MRILACIALLTCLAFTLRAEEPAPEPAPNAGGRATKLPAPSNAKFNSTVSNNLRPPAYSAAPAGQALTADGTGLLTKWAFIKGTTIDSNVAGSPTEPGWVLTADGEGKARWLLNSPSSFSGVVQITNGGTGSNTQNFVDLTTEQLIDGEKTFSMPITGTLIGNAVNVTGIVQIANGGTGSATKNFVDLTTDQSPIAGKKTFSNLDLPKTTGANAGVITQNGTPLLHTYGIANLFVGPGAGNFSMDPNNAAFNTVIGNTALQANTRGSSNVACGSAALQGNTTGSDNVACGNQALQNNTTGAGNVAYGSGALPGNTTGIGNIALGYLAGLNIGLNNNIDIGNNGFSNDNGIIRIGDSTVHTDSYLAGIVHGNFFDIPATAAPGGTATAGVITQAGTPLMHTYGAGNLFVGLGAGNFSMSSDFAFFNTAIGDGTLHSNTIGAGNVACGNLALQNNATGSGNIALGYLAGINLTAGSNNIYIGNVGGPTESGFIRIGDSAFQTDSYLAGIVHGNFFDIPATAAPAGTATAGVITQAGTPLMHTYGDNNLFVGLRAGNFTMDQVNANSNTAIGNAALQLNTGGRLNVACGDQALQRNTTGIDNVACGSSALQNNTTGSYNTASGYSALFSNTTGTNNTASGLEALYSNTTGAYNTASGFQALFSNTTGGSNVALGNGAGFNITLSNNIDIGNVGFGADTGIIRIGASGTHTDTFMAGIVHADDGLSVNKNAGAGAGTFVVEARAASTGTDNTFIGLSAGKVNTTGSDNFAFGMQALSSNKGGTGNIAIGPQTLALNVSGNNNVAIGTNSQPLSTGSANMALGSFTLFNNTTGQNNMALGASALAANTTGSNNIAVGFNAGSKLTNGSNNIDIGHVGVAGEGNTIRIGTQGTQTTTIVAGIFGATVTGGSSVMIDANGHLGTVTSSRRFKDNIQPMGATSDALLKLNPVTFTYKKELDAKRIPQWGLIAEEVAAINPDWVVYDDKGVINTVRYEQINAMLLNEFLKEHKKVETLADENAELKKSLAAQDARLARIEKMMEEGQPKTVRALAEKE